MPKCSRLSLKAKRDNDKERKRAQKKQNEECNKYESTIKPTKQKIGVPQPCDQTKQNTGADRSQIQPSQHNERHNGTHVQCQRQETRKKGEESNQCQHGETTQPVTDYAIARRIVDLHSRNEESVERVFSVEDIQRYITFARQFKPKISVDSKDFMVEEYRRLRQRDGSGSASKSSWRITVRQLESMIRLSESMARMHCQDEVQPKHVKEAFRLLNKSIIRVEQPDVHLEEDDEDEAPMDLGAEDEENKENAESQTASQEVLAAAAEKPTRKPIKLTFEEYKQISHMFVFYMRKQEEEAEEDSAGVRRSELVNWYLKEMEHEIETEAELNERKILAEKVINRLVNVDYVIIQLDATGLQQRKKTDEQTLVREEDPILVVHPNYVPSDA